MIPHVRRCGAWRARPWIEKVAILGCVREGKRDRAIPLVRGPARGARRGWFVRMANACLRGMLL